MATTTPSIRLKAAFSFSGLRISFRAVLDVTAFVDLRLKTSLVLAILVVVWTPH